MELVYNSRLWGVVGGSGHASDWRQAFEGPLLIEVKNWLVCEKHTEENMINPTVK